MRIIRWQYISSILWTGLLTWQSSCQSRQDIPDRGAARIIMDIDADVPDGDTCGDSSGHLGTSVLIGRAAILNDDKWNDFLFTGVAFWRICEIMAHGPQLADMVIQAIAAYTRGPAPFPDAETAWQACMYDFYPFVIRTKSILLNQLFSTPLS